MLTRHTLLHCEVEIDKEKTREWYAQAEEWGCECGHCRNFLKLAKGKRLPQGILAHLAALEIPPEKATYVCQLTETEDGHLYQFSYRIAGNILREDLSSKIADMRCCHETYPYGAPGFPEPHFDLEFYAWLPWVPEDPAP